MKTVICDINLFSMDQPVYAIEGDGQMKLEFYATLDDLGPALVDYCEQQNVQLLRIYDRADYAHRLLIPAIKDYAFHKYAKFETQIEVEKR